MKQLILVATYNEADNIGPLIERLRAVAPQASILIADDRSPDGTGEQVAELARRDGAVNLLSRKGPRGYGFAMIEGFAWALHNHFDHVVTLDADFSHDPAAIPELFAALERGSDMAIGSRFVDGVRVLNWEISRLLLSLGANQYVRKALFMPYADCTSGFRGYQARALRAILRRKIRSRGYSFLVETLFWVHRAGCRVVEEPIVYSERRRGQSKMSKAIIFEAVLNPWRLWIEWMRTPRKQVRMEEE